MMPTGLQSSPKALLLDTTLVKLQPVDAETPLQVPFGEILKFKEKLLQQEQEAIASTLVAAFTSMQALPTEIDLPIPSVETVKDNVENGSFNASVNVLSAYIKNQSEARTLSTNLHLAESMDASFQAFSHVIDNTKPRSLFPAGLPQPQPSQTSYEKPLTTAAAASSGSSTTAQISLQDMSDPEVNLVKQQTMPFTTVPEAAREESTRPETQTVRQSARINQSLPVNSASAQIEVNNASNRGSEAAVFTGANEEYMPEAGLTNNAHSVHISHRSEMTSEQILFVKAEAHQQTGTSESRYIENSRDFGRQASDLSSSNILSQETPIDPVKPQDPIGKAALSGNSSGNIQTKIENRPVIQASSDRAFKPASMISSAGGVEQHTPSQVVTHYSLSQHAETTAEVQEFISPASANSTLSSYVQYSEETNNLVTEITPQATEQTSNSELSVQSTTIRNTSIAESTSTNAIATQSVISGTDSQVKVTTVDNFLPDGERTGNNTSKPITGLNNGIPSHSSENQHVESQDGQTPKAEGITPEIQPGEIAKSIYAPSQSSSSAAQTTSMDFHIDEPTTSKSQTSHGSGEIFNTTPQVEPRPETISLLHAYANDVKPLVTTEASPSESIELPSNTDRLVENRASSDGSALEPVVINNRSQAARNSTGVDVYSDSGIAESPYELQPNRNTTAHFHRRDVEETRTLPSYAFHESSTDTVKGTWSGLDAPKNVPVNLDPGEVVQPDPLQRQSTSTTSNMTRIASDQQAVYAHSETVPSSSRESGQATAVPSINVIVPTGMDRTAEENVSFQLEIQKEKTNTTRVDAQTAEAIPFKLTIDFIPASSEMGRDESVTEHAEAPQFQANALYAKSVGEIPPAVSGESPVAAYQHKGSRNEPVPQRRSAEVDMKKAEEQVRTVEQAIQSSHLKSAGMQEELHFEPKMMTHADGSTKMADSSVVSQMNVGTAVNSVELSAFAALTKSPETAVNTEKGIAPQGFARAELTTESHDTTGVSEALEPISFNSVQGMETQPATSQADQRIPTGTGSAEDQSLFINEVLQVPSTVDKTEMVSAGHLEALNNELVKTIESNLSTTSELEPQLAASKADTSSHYEKQIHAETPVTAANAGRAKQSLQDVDAHQNEFDVPAEQHTEKGNAEATQSVTKSEATVTRSTASAEIINDQVIPSSKEIYDTGNPEDAKQSIQDEDTSPVEGKPIGNQASGMVTAADGPGKGTTAIDPNTTGFLNELDVQITEVVQQVVRHSNTNLKKGATSMYLKLNPGELGAIDVQMVSSPQGVHVTFIVEQDTTGKLLENQLGQLRESLANSGVQLSGFDISQHHQSKQKGGTFDQTTNFARTPQREFSQGETPVREIAPAERRTGQSSEIDYFI